MKLSADFGSKCLQPFVIATVVWLISLGVAIFWTPFEQLIWAAIIGSLGLLDLYATSRALVPFFQGSVEDPVFKKNQGYLYFQAFTWGSIKLVSLTLIGFIFFKVKDLPLVVIALGLSVFILIPLLGGVLWFLKNKSPHEEFSPHYDDSDWGSFKRVSEKENATDNGPPRRAHEE